MKGYYTKEEVVQEGFLFISDKREDSSETVYDTLNYLFEQGVRFWYDADLGVGEKWTEIAEGLIKHPNCRGVVFFNSIPSFTSEPVHKERGFTLEKQKKCREEKTPFCIFPVNIGQPSVLELIKAVFYEINDLTRLKREFPIEYIKNITTLFDSEIIYCYADPNNKEGYRSDLCNIIAKSLPQVINKDVVRMKKFEDSGIRQDGKRAYFGKCADKQTADVPASLLSKDGRISLNGNNYIVQNGSAYTIKKIPWRLLYCKDDKCVLISEEPVGVRTGGAELKQWLTDSFFPLAFTEEEKTQVEEIRLATLEDVQKAKSEEKLVFLQSEINPDGHWWIDSMAHGALQKVVKKDGRIFAAGYNMRTKKSGVRPIIVVNNSTLTKIIENY